MKWIYVFFLLALALISLLFDVQWLFVIFLLLAIAIIIAKFIAGSIKFGKVVGKEMTADIVKDMEAANPETNFDEITKFSAEDAGRKAGQLAFRSNRYRFTNKGVMMKLHRGTKDFIRWFGKIFK